MHGEMTRSVGLVGCVTVTIALGSCGSGGIAIGVDAGQADAPMATLADGAGGDAVRGDADVLPGQADAPMATLADGASGDAVRGDADVLPAQADAPMATGDAGADGGHVIPVAVSAGLFSTCALLSNGTARCWGYNYYGQLGNATTTDSTTPVVVQGLNDAVSISASDGYHACAVRANGTAQCWGGNLYGDLGDGAMVDSSSIKTVLNLHNIATISTGGNATCAALVDGTAYCWGEASGVWGGTSVPLPLKGVVSIQASDSDICALLADGTVDCWGDNTSGQIGNGTYADPIHPVSTPTAVQGLNHVVAISTGTGGECAVLADGTAACWGDNDHGQLGNGTVIGGPPYGSSTPVAVSGLTNVVAITTAGYYACALLSDGSVSCWGDNECGTLGNGTTTDSSLPIAVPGLNDIVAISAGIDHVCALAADGTIWCWGLNLNGELGHAPTNDSCKGAVCSMTPVRVDWSTNPDGGLDSTFPPARDAAQESLPASADGGVPCRLSSDCANLGGTFCQKDSCDPSVIGLCAAIPGFCQAEVNFVCGCDGMTYKYPCLAHAQSVNIASQGPCPLPAGGAPCATNSDCGIGLYCKKESCAAAIGLCTGEPDFQVCFAESKDAGQSACGCDHQTYLNDCETAAYGVNVDFEGACPPLPSGPCASQSDCGDQSYTALVFCRPTSCGGAAGVCTSISNACPGLSEPVCGCNGNRYVNACFAERARVGWYTTDSGCP
jgi:alpha-tubulin suppressor-like RCC1 family protein